MATPNPVIEEEVDSAFRAGSDFGVQYLVMECRNLILQHIKRAGLGYLSPEDMVVVYHDTIVGVIERTKDPNFDPCRSLRMVYGIARNTLLSHVRRRQLERARAAQLRPSLLAPPAAEWSLRPAEEAASRASRLPQPASTPSRCVRS